jgi:hypothetical protein
MAATADIKKQKQIQTNGDKTTFLKRPPESRMATSGGTGGDQQRLQFEYIIPNHSIFSDVAFAAGPVPSGIRPPTLTKQPFGVQIQLRPEDHESLLQQQVITSYPGSGADIAANDIIVDSDDVEYAPTTDGELTSGCRKCGGVNYGSSTELKLHFGSVHSRQTFECCVCNKLFLRRHGFLVHIKRYQSSGGTNQTII